MALPSEKIHTQTLTNSTLLIEQPMGVRAVSLILVSGLGTFVGTLQIGAYPSTPIDLQIGVPIKISSDNATPLDGIMIDCSSGGVIEIMAKQ